MKANALEIAWHVGADGKNQPMLSIDFHPFLPLFATAGSDNEVKLWSLDRDVLDKVGEEENGVEGQVHQFIYLFIHPSIYLPIYLPICLF